MVPRCRTNSAVGVGVLASTLVAFAGCGFGDLLRPVGPRDIAITYLGDTVLSVGTSAAVAIAASAQGAPLPNPEFTLSSSDTTTFVLSAARDSLVPRSNGSAELIVRLIDPAFTDSMPTLAVRIRVRGGA